MNVSYVTVVENNEFGAIELKEIKRIAKLNDCRVRIQGRTTDRKALAMKRYSVDSHMFKYHHDCLRQSLTKEQSERFAVYVKRKHYNYNVQDENVTKEEFEIMKSNTK